MKNLLKTWISKKTRKTPVVTRPASRAQIKMGAERFVREYGAVIKKLSQE